MDDFKLDFVGVGAAKAATRWLYECLRQHPQVCMPEQGELNYFCARHIWPKLASNRSEGEQWLRARFAHWQLGQLRGEISPSYLVDPDSPRLIKERFPDAKIIISYRNPTDALYSLYWQVAKHHSVPPVFEQFVADNGFVIQYGFYHTHTLRYLDNFPLNRIHFIVYDDICSEPAEVVVHLFGFLGIATAWQPERLYQRVNVRKAPRVVLIRDIIAKAQELASSSPRALRLRRVARFLRLHHVGSWIREKNLRAAAFPPMRQETRKRLLALYGQENALLGDLLGRDLNHWNE